MSKAGKKFLETFGPCTPSIKPELANKLAAAVAGLAGGLEPVGLAEVQAQVAAIGGETGADAPDENGYVADPVDASAYLSASLILGEHSEGVSIADVKELGRILENYAETRVRWTRPAGKDGKPRLNRRLVHAGDWAAHVARCRGMNAVGEPRDDPAEIEARKNAARKHKSG